jgi:hypothetical protein
MLSDDREHNYRATRSYRTVHYVSIKRLGVNVTDFLKFFIAKSFLMSLFQLPYPLALTGLFYRIMVKT